MIVLQSYKIGPQGLEIGEKLLRKYEEIRNFRFFPQSNIFIKMSFICMFQLADQLRLNELYTECLLMGKYNLLLFSRLSCIVADKLKFTQACF